MALALGGSDLAGSASLRSDGGPPRVKADLTADRPDLHELDARPDAAGRAVGDAVLFWRSPLPFDALFRLDLQLRLRAASVRISIGELAQMELTATLDAGQLNVHPLAFRLIDRPVGGAIMVDAAAKPALELKLSDNDLDLGRLMAGLAPDATVPGKAMVLQGAVLIAQAEKGLARMGLLAEGPEGNAYVELAAHRNAWVSRLLPRRDRTSSTVAKARTAHCRTRFDQDPEAVTSPWQQYWRDHDRGRGSAGSVLDLVLGPGVVVSAQPTLNVRRFRVEWVGRAGCGVPPASDWGGEDHVPAPPV